MTSAEAFRRNVAVGTQENWSIGDDPPLADDELPKLAKASSQ